MKLCRRMKRNSSAAMISIEITKVNRPPQKSRGSCDRSSPQQTLCLARDRCRSSVTRVKVHFKGMEMQLTRRNVHCSIEANDYTCWHDGAEVADESFAAWQFLTILTRRIAFALRLVHQNRNSSWQCVSAPHRTRSLDQEISACQAYAQAKTRLLHWNSSVQL